ncbi:hypothetical protein D3C73_1553680 [compost metagenome]
MADEQLHLLGQLNGGSIGGGGQVTVQVLEERLEGGLAFPVAQGLRLMLLFKKQVQHLHRLPRNLHMLGNINGADIGMVEVGIVLVAFD